VGLGGVGALKGLNYFGGVIRRPRIQNYNFVCQTYQALKATPEVGRFIFADDNSRKRSHNCRIKKAKKTGPVEGPEWNNTFSIS
jgi:hypothetical protein